MNDTPLNLNILIISSRSNEIETLKAKVRSFAPKSIFVIAKNYSCLKKKISWIDYHMIICDHELPGNQAQKANIRLRIQLPHVPFILLTACPEIEKNQYSKNNSSWDIRAIIRQDQLAGADTVLQSVFNNSAHNLEMERAHQLRSRQKSLLLQKFESSIKQSLLPLDAHGLDELSDRLFSKHKVANNTSIF